jgi:hypothetical protein
MKTNFKKLALTAGISAAMAAGSMSAHAVIQAVPAPAALVPLFTTSNGTVSTVRIEVPQSVGVDSVVNLFGGPNIQGGQLSSQGTVAAGLSPTLTGGLTQTTSRIHWVWMDVNSNELLNGSFPVSANDVVHISSKNMPYSGGFVALDANTPGYLVLVNESAYSGGAPTFSFQADAFVSNDGNVANIPVFPLTDSADNGAVAPTLTNNVVETYPVPVPEGSPYGEGPIVSPIVSGIRTGANVNGADANWFRVIDMPLTNGVGSTYVVWNDRNGIRFGDSDIVTYPGITGTTFTYDCNENALSGPTLTLNNQLNFVSLGATTGNVAGFLPKKYWGMGGSASFDTYTGVPISNMLGGNKESACVDAKKDPNAPVPGYLRWILTSPINYGKLQNAAYSAAVIFRLDTTEGLGKFPVDRGFFISK